jgi:spore maturation protein SpmA
MPTTVMTDLVVEIMVEVLTILAIATKEVKCGQLSELMSDRFGILTEKLSRKIFEEVDGEHRHRG